MKNRAITLKAPAKVNLYLRILGRRPDGYHDIESLLVPIDLCDGIEIARAPAGIGFSCEGLDGLPAEKNLARRAASAFIDRFGVSEGVSIHLKKLIPAGAGLGGGSSDAASVLLGMDRLFPGLATPETLQSLAAQIGSDVPFFLARRPAWIRGRGEVVEPLSGRVPEFHAVLVCPGFGVSTAWAYAEWDGKHPRLTEDRRGASNHPPVWAENGVIRGLRNDFEDVVFAAHPGLRGIKGALLAAEAKGALLSGSGSTVFGVFRTERKAVKAAAHLAGVDAARRVFVARGLTEGTDQ